MRPWFERYPSRLQRELDALDEAGFAYEVDEAQRAAGRILIKVAVPHNGKTYNVEAHFPFTYPYTPFELLSSDVPDGRHKDPYRHGVCFMHNVKSQWSMSRDTLAKMLDENLRTVIDQNLNPSNDPEVEALDAAPVTSHIVYEDNQCILIPAFDIPPDIQHGHAVMAHHPGTNISRFTRGHIVSISGPDRRPFYEMGGDLPGLTILEQQCHHIGIRWVRLDGPPAKLGPDILTEAALKCPELARPIFKGGPDIIGLVFSEETAHNVFQDNWIFVRRAKSGGQNSSLSTAIIRADILDPVVVAARTPSLAPLTGKKVSIIGCGAIGSAIALQMGRLPLGELVLVDRDHLQTGNLPRWVAGANASGLFKVVYLAREISEANPFIKVSPYTFELGQCVRENLALEIDIMSDIFDDADLIIDATAEFTASHLITDLAKEQAVPCIHVTGTPGSYGGIVSRFLPSPDAFCWACLQKSLQDGSIPLPPDGGPEMVQVRGCFHPTFTGTGFDMDYIALAATRLAVSTLCRGAADGYPDLDWDVAVISTWDQQSGTPVVPQWRTFAPVHHPDCVKNHG